MPSDSAERKEPPRERVDFRRIIEKMANSPKFVELAVNFGRRAISKTLLKRNDMPT